MARIEINDLPVEAQVAQDEQKQLSGGASPQLAKLSDSASFGRIEIADRYANTAGITDGTSNTLMNF